MATEQAVHMNGGQGDTSYARNSSLQNAEQKRMRPLIEEAIDDLLSTSASLPRSMVVADLGCSSGPNALTLVSICVDAVRSRCLCSRQPPVEVCCLPQRSSRQRLQHGGEELGCVPAKPQVGCHRCYTRVVLREALHQWLLASRLLSHQPALALQVSLTLVKVATGS